MAHMISLSSLARSATSCKLTRLCSPRMHIVTVLPSRDLKGATRAYSTSQAVSKAKPSPYQQFRASAGVLSVNDLSSPAWCEVQFDYGLRQGRRKKLAERPKSFVTAKGKTIEVAQPVAALRDRAAMHGQSVHKTLEREIQLEAVTVTAIGEMIAVAQPVATGQDGVMTHGQPVQDTLERKIQPEAVPVGFSTPLEERFMNMLVSLQTLLKQGRCREVFVFGMIRDQLVIGGIDEIVRIPVPKRKPKSQPVPPVEAVRSSSSNEPSASRSSRRSRSKKKSQNADAAIRYSLHLSDTKTRRRPYFPPVEDTCMSRIQLMLYYRLLSNLLAAADPSIKAETPLDFDLLWKHIGLDPHLKFSDSFISQAGLNSSSDNSSSPAASDGPSCLHDLIAAWRHAVKALNVASIARTLTLVYYAQVERRSRKLKREGTRKQKSRRQDPESVSIANQTVQGLAATVQAAPCSPALTAQEFADGRNMAAADTKTAGIFFGRTKFRMHDTFLDEYLTRVLAWWHGQRPPQGVEAELYRRCKKCEYKDGCEWREQKAEEALRNSSGRNDSDPTSTTDAAGIVKAGL